MTKIKTISAYFLFFSLPLVAALKGKGIVASLILVFLFFGGLDSLMLFIKEKGWKKLSSKNFLLFIIPSVILLFWGLREGTLTDLLYLARLILLLGCVFFTVKGASNLSSEDRQILSYIFLHGYIVYLVFFLFEIYGVPWVSRVYSSSDEYNSTLFIRGIVILTFLFLPFIFVLQQIYSSVKKYLLLSTSFVALILILLKAQPSASRLALIVAIIFFLVSYFWKNLRYLILSVVTLYITIIPFLFLHFINRQTLFENMHYLPLSYQHRIEIWNETSKKIAQKPLFGHGFDYGAKAKTSTHRCAHYPLSEFHNTISDKNIVIKSTVPFPWGGVICHEDTILTTHPHNGPLQIWLEFGLVGICFVYFLLYQFGSYLNRQTPLYGSYLFSLFGLSLVYWGVSFGLWQKWMISLVALTFWLFQLIKGLPLRKKGISECMN